MRQRVPRQILLRAPVVAFLLLRGLRLRGLRLGPGWAGRWRRPGLLVGPRVVVPVRSWRRYISLWMRTRGAVAIRAGTRRRRRTRLVRRSVINLPAHCLLQLSAATGNALLNGFLNTAIAVTNDGASSLSHVSKITRCG